MKIKSLLIGMLASTAFVACTNENEPVINEQEGVVLSKSYVAVNVVTPKGAEGRATANDFEAGSTDEVAVNGAVFLYLDANMNGCAAPYYVAGNDLSWADANGLGQDQKANVLVVDEAKEVPSYIVAVLNPVGGANHGYTASTTLAELKATHATYTAYTNSNFVMTNAVYRAANGKEAAATPVPVGKIHSSEAEAVADPVTIFVERVVGKVAVTGLDAAAEGWENDEQLDDQENKALELVITGWEVLQNVESTLVKNIDLAWNHAWWNDITLQRSYWAKDYTAAGRTAYLVDAMETPQAGFRYVEETVSQTANTVEVDDVNPYLLVTGKFVDAKTKEAVNLVEWRGRKYTLDGYLNFIAGNSEISQYWTKSGDTYTSFSAELLEMVDDSDTDWKAEAMLKDANTQFYTIKSFNVDGTVKEAAAVETSEVVAAIEKFGEVQYWNGGRTYYYTPIKHQTVGTDNFYGVVRNHVYKVSISAISGYGTPVANPEQAIEIPEKPTDDKSYLAADVVILDWKVVLNENVELN